MRTMMKEIRAEVEIKGSSEQVWRGLTQFEKYPEWNPFIRKISGELLDGAKLDVTISTFIGMNMDFKLTVDSILQNRGMRWLGQTLMPGLLDGKHYFEIKQLEGGKVQFVQYEQFSGLLLPVSWVFVSRSAKRNFESMNLGLKEWVESGKV